MIIKILEVGDILRNKKTNKLHQITKITSTSVFIKRIGNMLNTPIRYTIEDNIADRFIIE